MNQVSTTPSPAGAPGEWLAEARAAVAQDPDAITRAFALAGRKVGRAALAPATDPAGVVHGTADDAARAQLVVVLADALRAGGTEGGEDGDSADRRLAGRLTTLYERGDTAERRGVLRGLDALVERDGAVPGPVAEAGVRLAEDALRANDQSLVAAAVGPFAAAHLGQHAWRHAVLKLVFMGVSLDAVAGLERRHDDELARMARDFAAERRAAGRVVPDDVTRLAPDLAEGDVPRAEGDAPRAEGDRPFARPLED